jgi:hypothetical protein
MRKALAPDRIIDRHRKNFRPNLIMKKKMFSCKLVPVLFDFDTASVPVLYLKG